MIGKPSAARVCSMVFALAVFGIELSAANPASDVAALHAVDQRSVTSRVEGPLSRRYLEGEKTSYHMTASNKDAHRDLQYEADAACTVKKNADGVFTEEFEWMGLVVGKETFDVKIVTGLRDGRLLSATLDNVVEVLERPSTKPDLSSPGAESRYKIVRKIEIHQTGAATRK